MRIARATNLRGGVAFVVDAHGVPCCAKSSTQKIDIIHSPIAPSQSNSKPAAWKSYAAPQVKYREQLSIPAATVRKVHA